MASFSSSTASLTMMESPLRVHGSAHHGDKTQHLIYQTSRPDNRSITWSEIDSVPGDLDDGQELVLTDLDPDDYFTTMFSPQAAARQQKYRVLGTFGLLGLMFFVSCGGPVGSEPIVGAGGPLVGLLMFAAYVILCLVPFAFTIAELGSAFPENGGFTVWIVAAFGPFWGFQVGYWSFISSALNNAIYPALMYSIVSDAFGFSIHSKVVLYVVKVAITCVLALPSLVSVRLVAGAACLMLAVVLLISAVFGTWGFVDGDLHWSTFSQTRPASQYNITEKEAKPDEGIDWVLLINSLFWNFDGLYLTSVIAGEVANPARTFPRVIFFTVSITTIVYLYPLISAVAADRMHWSLFDEDAYPTIGRAMGGTTLHHMMALCSLLSTAGLFACSIFFQSFMILGMAEMRLLPAIFRKRGQIQQTPQRAVLLSLCVSCLLLAIDYESILGMTNSLSAGIQVMIVLAMLQLRQRLPYIPRPTKVPGGVTALCVVLLPTTALFVYILFSTLFEPASALVLGVLLIPGVVYGVYQRRLLMIQARVRARQQQQLQQPDRQRQIVHEPSLDIVLPSYDSPSLGHHY